MSFIAAHFVGDQSQQTEGKGENSEVDAACLRHTELNKHLCLDAISIEESANAQAALNEAAIVAVTDARGTIISVNKKFCEISGYSELELIGANHRLLKSGVHDRAFFHDIYQTISAGKTWHGTICNRAKDRKIYWVDTTIVTNRDVAGNISGYTAIRFDVTPLKQAKQELWRNAHFDELTGVANRRHFFELLNRAIARVDQQPFVVAMVDLDHFKDVNDTFGHAVGDRLLKDVAQVLEGALMPDEIVGRLGGDEFVLVLHGADLEQIESERVPAILRLLAEIRYADGAGAHNSVSIGLVRFPENGRSQHALMRRADLALYAAKRSGGNGVCVFRPALEEDAARRSEMRLRFFDALAEGNLKVFYQPIISIRHEHSPSFEALLRWVDDDGTVMTPASFADLFDDNDIACEVGAFVLRTVLAQIERWAADDVDFRAISINATAADLHSDFFVDAILDAVNEGRINSRQLCVEITEGMLLDRQAKRVRQAIDTLHSHGVQIAFDDFGTGFASLTHLRELPIDHVKIDRSFIQSLCGSEKDRVIVESVISLAHRLGLGVVAEGVEDCAQMDLLRAMGCDRIQGFLISPAIETASVEAFLREFSPPATPTIREVCAAE